MIRSKFKIMHDAGLNARPAALFVQVSSKYNSRIWVQIGSKKVNAKSIMGVMSLGVAKDGEIEVIIEGNDEQKALEALKELIDSNFSHIPSTDKH